MTTEEELRNRLRETERALQASETARTDLGKRLTIAEKKRRNEAVNTCVCCGREIPEGRMVCPACEMEADRGVEIRREGVAKSLRICRDKGTDCQGCAYRRLRGREGLCIRTMMWDAAALLDKGEKDV